MKFEICPNCNWKLAVPTKMAGAMIPCPKCDKSFQAECAGEELPREEMIKTKRLAIEAPLSHPAKEVVPPTKKAGSPDVRSLPIPPKTQPTTSDIKPAATNGAAVMGDLGALPDLPDFESDGGIAKTAFGVSSDEPVRIPADTLARLNAAKAGGAHPNSNQPVPAPTNLNSSSKPNGSIQTKPGATNSRHLSPPAKSVSGETATLSNVGTPVNFAALQRERSPVPAPTKTTRGSRIKQPATARIIEAQPIEQQLTKDGKLPTLKLKDEVKQSRIDTKELKSNPVFLAVLVCSSLLTTGMILFFADAGSSANQKALDNARTEISRFYETRIDVSLKPYQVSLREAQLAHSRGDRDAEVAAYRQVMALLKAEDKNPYAGVTGSPTADGELEQLVSILLGSNGRGNSFIP